VVLAREGPILVEFYSPYCGHCVTFAPELEKIANDLQVFLPVGQARLSLTRVRVRVRVRLTDVCAGRDQVDVTKHSKLRSKYDVNGVPAIFLFGEDKEHPQVYSGRHDQRSVVQFVLNNVNHSCVTLTPAITALPRFLAKRDDTAGALPRIVYFDKKDSQDPPVQFATLAHTYVRAAPAVRLHGHHRSS
jgi:thiol-disulfide isomerase/thioredoxin